jgi:hypothetical protein
MVWIDLVVSVFSCVLFMRELSHGGVAAQGGSVGAHGFCARGWSIGGRFLYAEGAEGAEDAEKRGTFNAKIVEGSKGDWDCEGVPILRAA